jgi:hypothetical protein
MKVGSMPRYRGEQIEDVERKRNPQQSTMKKPSSSSTICAKHYTTIDAIQTQSVQVHSRIQ